MADLDKERTVYLLNRILESELAGVVRYTHYSFLVLNCVEIRYFVDTSGAHTN